MLEKVAPYSARIFRGARCGALHEHKEKQTMQVRSKSKIAATTAAIIWATAGAAARAQTSVSTPTVPPAKAADAQGAALAAKLGKSEIIANSVFVGKVVRVGDDGETLVVENERGARRTVRLWGTMVAADQRLEARKFLDENAKNKTVRVEEVAPVTSTTGARRPDTAVTLAKIALLPDAPDKVRSQFKASRSVEASGTSNDQPRGVDVALPASAAPVSPPSNETVLNYLIVRAGLAKWDRVAAPDDTNGPAAEDAARKDGLGAWNSVKRQ